MNKNVNFKGFEYDSNVIFQGEKNSNESKSINTVLNSVISELNEGMVLLTFKLEAVLENVLESSALNMRRLFKIIPECKTVLVEDWKSYKAKGGKWSEYQAIVNNSFNIECKVRPELLEKYPVIKDSDKRNQLFLFGTIDQKIDGVTIDQINENCLLPVPKGMLNFQANKWLMQPEIGQIFAVKIEQIGEVKYCSCNHVNITDKNYSIVDVNKSILAKESTKVKELETK